MFKEELYGNTWYKGGDSLLTVSFSVNGEKIEKEELRCIEIKRKDYIDYIDSIKNNIRNFDKDKWAMKKVEKYI